MSCLRLCVNVDYLLLIYSFFVEGLPNVPASTNSSSSKEIVEDKSLNLSLNDSVELAEMANQRLLVDFRIEHPQFILYEDQHELKKSNSLIVDVSGCFTLRKKPGSFVNTLSSPLS
jgi:hypothetical protein